MTFRKTTLTAVVFASLVGIPAAIAQMQGMDMQKMMQMMTVLPNDPPSTKDFKQAHMAMMKNMNMEFSGDADVDFAQSMVPHHQGGIDMAKLQLKYGKDPELRKMAETIIKDQEKEQKEFKSFLKKHQK